MLLTLSPVMAFSAEKRLNSQLDVTQNGRYQVFFGPLARADTFLVDTATGRAWRAFQNPNSDQVGWEEMPRFDLRPAPAPAPAPE
jgi:hypothetical protein